MRKLNEKMIKRILALSILFNLFFIGYGILKAIRQHDLYKSSLIDSKGYDLESIRTKMFNNLPDDTDEIIMLGNSQTQNFEWHELFKNVNIKNRGIAGETTKEIIQRLNDIIERKPKKIFIEIGINDLLQGSQTDSILNNYKEIIQTIKLNSPGTRIHIQSIFPTNWMIYNSTKPVIDSVRVLNKNLKDYCVNNNVIYIDLYSKFDSNNKLNPIYDCGDNLHLSPEGYLE